MSYLKVKHNSWLDIDAIYPKIDHVKFNNGDNWSTMNAGAEEAVPHNTPKPLRKSVDL